jgi:DNA topoisomerase IB
MSAGVRYATNKYARMLEFAAALPRIRQQVERDLSLPELPRQKVLAGVVRLLERTFIRVGNEEYARANASFGLTTMRDRHVRVAGSSLRFRFRGKGGKEHRVDLTDRRLARLIRHCQELPGEELFKYVDDDDVVQSVGSADGNAFLRESWATASPRKTFALRAPRRDRGLSRRHDGRRVEGAERTRRGAQSRRGGSARVSLDERLTGQPTRRAS